MTAFYAFCPSQCLALMRAPAEVQMLLLQEGVESVTILAITFDLERDTAPKLDEHADRMDVDLGAGN